MLSLPTLSEIQHENPKTYQALKKLLDAFNRLASQAGIDPTAPVTQTPTPGQLQISVASGLVEFAIQDAQATQLSTQRTITYFLEYDTQPSFATAKTKTLGASRNGHIQLGNQTLYFRCYSQFQGSAPSGYATFGNPPTAVVCGGSAPPAPLASQGSGTSLRPGFGYGSSKQ